LERIVRRDLDGQTLAPAVLLAREGLRPLPGVTVTLSIQCPGRRRELAVAEPAAHAGIVRDVADPLRPVEMLGEDIKLPA
jgi:hypothetical protein